MTINEIKRENGNIYLEMVLCHRDFDRFFVYCEDCGEIVLKEKAIEIDGEYYCSCCVLTCDTCGCLVPRRYSHTVEDSDYIYCNHCYNEQTYYCDDCGRRFRYSDSVTEVDDSHYCDRCIEEHRSPIECYHTFKQYGDIKFYGTEERAQTPYMGFELEVDTDDYQVDRTAVINRFKNNFGDFMHYEEDGSLRHGWENISQPASLSYHLGMMDKYKNMFEILTEEDLRSHDANTCGLHVHIDRKYFGKSEDTAISKILYSFERFRSELKVFSRRTESQANDWARSRKHSNTKSGWIKKAIKDSKHYYDHSERYYAVNLTNPDTVEIRIFRGTLNLETFEATLKFTAHLAELCKTVSAVELSKFSFEDLLGNDETILSYWSRVKQRTATNEEEF